MTIQKDAVPLPSARPGAAREVPADRPLLYRAVFTFCRFVSTVLYDLKVFGAEHVPTSGGVLLVTNHESYLDPVVIGVLLPRPMSYLAQSGLFKNPLFGWLLRKLFAFPVDQGKGDVGAVKETIRLLREGKMLNIFPEGSRSPDGTLQTVLPGVALVIKRAGVPVVPCVIEGAFEAWPRHRLLPRGGRVRVLYGPAMDFTGVDAREIVRRIDSTLRTMIPRLEQLTRERDGLSSK